MRCLFLIGRELCSKQQAMVQRPNFFPLSGSTITNMWLPGPPTLFLHESAGKGKNAKLLTLEIFRTQSPKHHKSFLLTFLWGEPTHMTSLQDRLGNAIYLCAKREGEKSDLQTWGNCKKFKIKKISGLSLIAFISAFKLPILSWDHFFLIRLCWKHWVMPITLTFSKFVTASRTFYLLRMSQLAMWTSGNSSRRHWRKL